MTKKWTVDDFPIGIYQLNDDQSVNFQMNRFFNWTNDKTMLHQMKGIETPQQTYPQIISAFKRLGQNALEEGNQLRAAMYLRAAEFYLPENNPSKKKLRDQFIELNNNFYGIDNAKHFLIPYSDGNISAYKVMSQNPQGTIVFVNGFDGYIEELSRMMLIFRDAGYNVIYFDGPGQGYMLENYHMPMTHQWEKPMKTVLDYFDIHSAIAIGMSLGGNLVLRAAAYEKRIKQVVCFDVLPDLFTCITHQLPEQIQQKIQKNKIIAVNKADINATLTALMRKSLMLQWVIHQGMTVLGADTPYDFIRKAMQYNTTKISPLVTQDVLLLAGQNDHYVPVDQLPLQISTLINAQSLTARIFTAEEYSSSHCQLGNIGLALTVILNWLKQTMIKQKKLKTFSPEI
ncbi:alpha beta hydrolase [Agrilactobacillus composti DSM 18527 = JCM 14202]|uniref:Alpha beta hydrolase n=1 Tax=Agrilactobacillus composti DSM 18527 = JCM 14202 TaxID=1423734 RepID=X0PCV1_9LACO|nr:alpha/beta hydrolase [Agrilactobacillus composti]KRM33040.1 alpha beta hydrolase [Agrilactobacillus composti DSM 18527 = JCM 14202]GAF38614.1 alpha/beta superfamily hydrolase [Agrilactobacillus composti DSM 18527 = JCM 14202]